MITYATSRNGKVWKTEEYRREILQVRKNYNEEYHSLLDDSADEGDVL